MVYCSQPHSDPDSECAFPGDWGAQSQDGETLLYPTGRPSKARGCHAGAGRALNITGSKASPAAAGRRGCSARWLTHYQTEACSEKRPLLSILRRTTSWGSPGRALGACAALYPPAHVGSRTLNNGTQHTLEIHCTCRPRSPLPQYEKPREPRRDGSGDVVHGVAGVKGTAGPSAPRTTCPAPAHTAPAAGPSPSISAEQGMGGRGLSLESWVSGSGSCGVRPPRPPAGSRRLSRRAASSPA